MGIHIKPSPLSVVMERQEGESPLQDKASVMQVNFRVAAELHWKSERL